MPTESRNIRVGRQAPDFTLPAVSGGQVTLSSYRGERHVVLVFLRGFFWPFCRRHLAQLRRDYGDFQARGAEVVVVAPDSLANSRAYFQRHQLPFPGLVDEKHAVYELYDVQSRILSMGRRPGLFIIDVAGTLRYTYHGTQQWEIPTNAHVLAQLDLLQEESG